MADTAEAKPLSDDGAANEPTNPAGSLAASSAKGELGKDVAFGTLLTVGPKEYRDITVLGYDRQRNTVRAMRRQGDSFLNIEVPYDEYKKLLVAQRASDLATGRRPKKNSAKVIRGFFGRATPYVGGGSQVVGYDAQSDEVLVKGPKGTRWIKSADILKASQSTIKVPANDTIATPVSTLPTINPLPTRRGNPLKDGKIKITAANDTVPDVSIDNAEKIPGGISAGTAFAGPSENVTVSAIDQEQEDQADAIAELRLQLSQAKAKGAKLEQAAQAITSVGVLVRDTNPAAAQAIAGAEKMLANLQVRAATRQTQTGQMKAQLDVLGTQINELQQQRNTLARGKNLKDAMNLLPQIKELQEQRDGLLLQMTNASAIEIFENQRAGELLAQVEKMVPTEEGEISTQGLEDLQKYLEAERIIPPPLASFAPPSLAGYKSSKAEQRKAGASAAATPPSTTPRLASPETPSLANNERSRADQRKAGASAAAAPPSKGPVLSAPEQPPLPSAGPRTYAPSAPIRTRLATTADRKKLGPPKPLRALTLNPDQQRAVRLGTEQQLARNEGYESAMAQEGGLPGYRGPLDVPEAKKRTYTAGAQEQEFESPDIYGASEEQARARQADINRGMPMTGPEAEAEDGQQGQQQKQYPQEQAPAEVPLSPEDAAPEANAADEVAKAMALQRMTAAALLAQQQQQEKQKKGTALQQAESMKKQVESVKKNFSRIYSAGDTILGAATFDPFELIEEILYLNLRLLLTFFKKKLPYVPQAGYPIECTAIGCFDLMMCLSVVSSVIMPFVFLMIVIGVIAGAFSIPGIIIEAANG